MKRVLLMLLSFFVGLVVGMAVNMGLLILGGKVIPAPEGADVTTVEGLRATMHLFAPKHFVFPFLAHALGTLAGALVATRTAPGRPLGMAFAIGVLFLCGGIANALMLPAPVWFVALDLIGAYIPMGWLAHRLLAGSRGFRGIAA